MPSESQIESRETVQDRTGLFGNDSTWDGPQGDTRDVGHAHDDASPSLVRSVQWTAFCI